MSDEVIRKVDALAEMSAEELQETLPGTLEDVRIFGAGRLLKSRPDALATIIRALLAGKCAGMFTITPAAAETFMRILWDGIESRSVEAPDLQDALKKTDRDVHVNIEASDSPLAGNFHITSEGITGGPGLVHFRDQDYCYMGRTDVLLLFLLGELPLGAYNLELQTAGHSGFAARAGLVLRSITTLLKGEPA
jgi:hypothetical protein